MTEEDKDLRALLLCRLDLFTRYFFRKQYNRAFQVARHHRIIADALMRVAGGGCPRLIINVPPRWGKTEVAVKMFVAWCLASNPAGKFVHLSYSDDLALDNSSAIRDIVKSEEYQRLFPTVLRADSDSKKKWWTQAHGGLYATAAGGAITGFGAGGIGRESAGTGSPADGFTGCFPYDELVSTEFGMMKIGDIVTKRIDVRVWSHNIQSGKDELEKIETFWTNPPNKIVEVRLSDGAMFRCTPNHEIMTDSGWVEARDLTGEHRIPLNVRFPDVLQLVTGYSTIADRVEPLVSGHRKPVLIRDVGHVDVTFCLQISSNRNFYVSSRQVLVSNCIIIDDPLKPDDAFSDTMRERINRRFNNTIASRTNSMDTPIVVIMQRLHEDDMTGFLLNGGSGETWEHLCLPAITSGGESLWPEKLSIERLREMENADPYTFAGQYMQRPAPLEGGLFKPDNIQIIPDLPVEPIEWVRGWDFASTTTGDWTAGVKLGRVRDGRLIIGDVVRIRVGPDERDKALLNAATRDGYECKQSIPQDPGQAGVTQVKYLLRQLAGFSVKSSPETGNKIVRAEPVASQVNVGNVMMLKADWNDGLISEMRMFPNGSFDDQVDGLSRAFSLLIGRVAAEIFIPDVGVKDIVASAGTCGRCVAFDAGMCKEHFGLQVGAGDTGCAMFIAG